MHRNSCTSACSDPFYLCYYHDFSSPLFVPSLVPFILIQASSITNPIPPPTSPVPQSQSPIAVPNLSPQSQSPISVPNPSPQSQSTIPVPNPGTQSQSQLLDNNLKKIPGRPGQVLQMCRGPVIPVKQTAKHYI